MTAQGGVSEQRRLGEVDDHDTEAGVLEGPRHPGEADNLDAEASVLEGPLHADRHRDPGDHFAVVVQERREVAGQRVVARLLFVGRQGAVVVRRVLAERPLERGALDLDGQDARLDGIVGSGGGGVGVGHDVLL